MNRTAIALISRVPSHRVERLPSRTLNVHLFHFHFSFFLLFQIPFSSISSLVGRLTRSIHPSGISISFFVSAGLALHTFPDDHTHALTRYKPRHDDPYEFYGRCACSSTSSTPARKGLRGVHKQIPRELRECRRNTRGAGQPSFPATFTNHDLCPFSPRSSALSSSAWAHRRAKGWAHCSNYECGLISSSIARLGGLIKPPTVRQFLHEDQLFTEEQGRSLTQFEVRMLGAYPTSVLTFNFIAFCRSRFRRHCSRTSSISRVFDILTSGSYWAKSLQRSQVSTMYSKCVNLSVSCRAGNRSTDSRASSC